MEKYNGYFNRDTWLVALWLNNEEKNYRRMLKEKDELLELSIRDFAFVLSVYNYGGDKIDFEKVNWEEIHKVVKEA
jgi:hypothetical protein